jgi:hypothetical protein
MIKATNATEIASEIREYTDQVEQKLQQMLGKFVEQATLAASSSTPIGSQLSIDIGRNASSGAEKKYYELYTKRKEEYGIEIEPGFHQGAWGYSNSDYFNESTTIRDPIDAARNAGDEATYGHQLGSPLYVGAKGPGFSFLEKGSSAQAPDGIGVLAIAKILAIDIKDLYDASLPQ